MIVKLIDFVELEDGGGKMTIECDAEFTEAAVQYYLTDILTKACDNNNEEYSYIITNPEEAGLMKASGEACECDLESEECNCEEEE